MWRKFKNNILVPSLFVMVAMVLALFTVDIVRYEQRQVAQSNEPEWFISPFDDMLMEMGEKYGIDWLLLSAIASVESKFNPEAVSKSGAVGLMQVMPLVAKSMGYAPEALIDAEVCVEVASRLLHENNDMLRLPSSFDKTERLNFILACYNAGYPRVADARRLARYHEDDADKWGVVATYLPLLAEPEYATHEVVQSGAFYGSAETIAYVRKVMRVYGRYKKRVAE